MWKWIKVPKGIALLAFLMPWMTVSCSGNPVISASGFGLAFGKFTSNLPQQGMQDPAGGSINLWLILALVAIIVGLVISFQPSAKEKAGGLLASSGAALLLIWVGTSRYGKSEILAEAAKKGGNSSNTFDRTAAAMIQVDWHLGFWLAILSLIAAGVMAWLIFTGRDDAVEARVRGAVDGARAPSVAPAGAEAHDCPTCGKTYPAATRFCPDDGTALT